MSSSYSSPDQLAQRLDRALPPGQSSLPPFTSDPLVNTAVELSRLRLPVLAPNASTRIEGRMLTAFNQQYRRRPTTSRRSVVTSAARWALVASVVCVLLIAGLTPAVAASVPGEPLYPVKQFYERVELAAARSPAAKTTVYLWHADRRTQEALVLLERKQFNLDLIDSALADIDEAGKLSDTLRASAHLRGELLQIQSLMGFVLQDARDTGLTTSEAIIQRVEQVQALGKSDLLLPLPAQEHNPNVAATGTPKSSSVPMTPVPADAIGITPTCALGQSCFAPGQIAQTTQTPNCERGNSCLAPGLATENPAMPTCEQGKSCIAPGQAVATSTPRPTHLPPTHIPSTHVPPTQRPTQPANAGGGNSEGGGSSENSSGGGANDNSGGNGGGNSGGNGNGNGGGNSGGNGKP